MERDAAEQLIAKRKLRFRFMRHDSWENALFVHWPVDPAAVAELLPEGLEPDLLDGSAWVGLVLLTERGVSAYHQALRRLVTPIDHFGANVRTYVRHKDVPGIFFWSLECSSLLASVGARLAGIPYCPARMWRKVDVERPLKLSDRGDELPSSCSQYKAPLVSDAACEEQATTSFAFSSFRIGSGACVSASWDITETLQEPERARWFVERYSVYSAWPLGGRRGPVLLRGDVQHPPWPLKGATVQQLNAEPLLAAAGLPGVANGAAQPHVCFSRGVGPVDFWMLEPVR